MEDDRGLEGEITNQYVIERTIRGGYLIKKNEYRRTVNLFASTRLNAALDFLRQELKPRL